MALVPGCEQLFEGDLAQPGAQRQPAGVQPFEVVPNTGLDRHQPGHRLAATGDEDTLAALDLTQESGQMGFASYAVTVAIGTSFPIEISGRTFAFSTCGAARAAASTLLAPPTPRLIANHRAIAYGAASNTPGPGATAPRHIKRRQA